MIDTCTDVWNDSAQRSAVRSGYCDGCGAAMPRALQEPSSAARWGKVWLCDDCMRTTPPEEIEHLRDAIALCGVPMS